MCSHSFRLNPVTLSSFYSASLFSQPSSFSPSSLIHHPFSVLSLTSPLLFSLFLHLPLPFSLSPFYLTVSLFIMILANLQVHVASNSTPSLLSLRIISYPHLSLQLSLSLSFILFPFLSLPFFLFPFSLAFLCLFISTFSLSPHSLCLSLFISNLSSLSLFLFNFFPHSPSLFLSSSLSSSCKKSLYFS